MDLAENSDCFTVNELEAGQRLDAVIASRAPSWISRSRIKSLVKAKNVQRNGQICASPDQRVQAGDIIQWHTPEPEDPTPKPENIPLDIVFEDEHVIVINKPAGLVVHPAAGNWSGTLVNALLHHCTNSLSGIGGVRRPGIVHRIDKDTSGLLVVAKTDMAHQHLATQFADHGRSGSLVRAYQALIWDNLAQPIGKIETYLGRDKNNRLKRAVVSNTTPDAKWAVTHYKIEKKLDFKNTENIKPPPLALVECRLETGRTHQIRVHMAHIGCPLVGDQLYGAAFQTQSNRLPLQKRAIFSNFKRQALHAKVLGFRHPSNDQTLIFEASIPDDMAALLP